MPPQCGMLTIGAWPMTLLERITALILAAVLNSPRNPAPERRDGFVLGLGVWDATEAVESVAVDAPVADVELASLHCETLAVGTDTGVAPGTVGSPARM